MRNCHANMGGSHINTVVTNDLKNSSLKTPMDRLNGNIPTDS